jgi:hypothetical protein
VINIEEYRARQIRQPTRWSSLFATASARHADRLTTPHGAVELAAKWGAVADCVYRSNSSGLCDIDNRALAVQAANTFLSQADQIASKPENFSANQVEVESLTQMKTW